MSTSPRLRSLYLCYLSLEDPLVHTQVVAYLRGLAAAGHHIHLLTFETARPTRAHRRRLRASMAQNGIRWHRLRYHKRPSLPATVYDALAGAVTAGLLVRRYRLDTLHARNHVPAAMALIAQRLAGPRRTGLIFDIRGLMAEEYEDAGRWRRGSVPFRLTKAVERMAIRRADGIVVLTERIRRALFGESSPRRVHVIPCCADLDALAATPADRQRVRAELGIDGATVMVYVGKFGGWYMAAEMAEFFAVARASIPGLRFLILTHGDRDEIRRELEDRDLARDCAITSAPPEELGRYLAAADFGISFIRPTPSKVSSSPTKIGEYLGAGLPVVSTSGIGDVNALISSEVGFLVSEHTSAAYRVAVQHLSRLLTREDIRDRCRELAQRELSLAHVGLPRYRQLYEAVRPIESCANTYPRSPSLEASNGAYPSPRTPALADAQPEKAMNDAV
jgi:glycosyltransferase involved in cell wall biosynthesis